MKSIFALLTSITLIASAGAGEFAKEVTTDAIAPSTDSIGLDVDALWHSHYFSEGLDSLDGADLVTGSAAYELGALSLFTWYGNSAEADYAEFQAGVEYGISVGGFDLYVGYLHLEFDDAGDTFGENEVGTGISYGDLPLGLTAALDWYYSFDFEGAYSEASIGNEIELTDRITLAPLAAIGFNDGYLADGHNGANSFRLQLDASVAITDRLSLIGYVSYNWAIDADAARFADDELARDFFFGGAGLAYSF